MNKLIIPFEPQRTDIPYHVGLIPDGGRRWAKKNNVTLLDSYRIAMQKTSEFVNCFFGKGVKVVSVYFASTQNFRRSKKQVQDFCIAETEFCNKYVYSILDKYSVKIKMAGLKEMLPDYFLDAIDHIENETANNCDFQLNLCIAYSNLDEIWQSIQKSSEKAEFLNNANQ